MDTEPRDPAPPNADSATWEEVRRWRKAMRAVLLARRMTMTAEARRRHHDLVTATLRQVLDAHPVGAVGAYWPFKGEFDPRPLMRDLHAMGRGVALPVVIEKNQPMIFRPWTPETAMASGIWDIPIPAEGGPVRPGVLLIPMLGYDRGRYRLGYGGGYYDRTLAAADRPLTIGVSHAGAELPTVYPQPHDIPLDIVVTEAGRLPG